MERRDSTYERLRSDILTLESASTNAERRLVWATDEHVVAVARDSSGRLEVFIPGEPLASTSKKVADVLEHQTWKSDDGSDMPATRVVLPLGEHFDHLGALLCVELVEHGVEIDTQDAFTAVEPLLALALSREQLGDLTLMGLVGELSLLDQLIAAAAPGAAREILHSWAGSAPSARDFQLGSAGIEVKTTQGAASVHHVEGVHQVELGSSNAGVIETALFMLSLGITWIDDPGLGTSLPELVDRLLERLEHPDDQADLLARIKQYGGDAAIGYDHARDKNRPKFQNRFYFRFQRLYDMTDERIKVLTRAHLEGLVNVDAGSVSFRVTLNDKVRGELNPVAGWDRLVKSLMERASPGRSGPSA